PILEQLYTPTGQKTITINGSNAEPGSKVEIFIEDIGSYGLRGTTTSDSGGNFTLDINLTLGENKITAKATDNSGNISRSSDMVVVVYNEPPAAPTGLTANTNNYNVNLTWSPNTEQDLSGYNIYRDGEKLNLPLNVISGNTSASSYYYYNPPLNAFDRNPSTYWMSNYGYGIFNPVWWEIALPSPELINHMELHWQNESYAGKDYEIQAWSGYAWITIARVTGNNGNDNSFDFNPPYRTDKIRVYITDTTDMNYSKQVRLSEVNILKDNLITETSYNDINLHDGEYNYKITAVDYYGFESLPSDEVKAIVGDVIPPSPPLNLTATASGPDIILNWSPNTEPDLAGYNIYRNTPQGWLKLNPSLITETTYIDAGLPNGTYIYKVTAVDIVGNEGLPSNEASVTVYITPPQPPINLTITSIPEGGALKASWDYAGTASGYNLYRSTTSGGPYTKVNNYLINNTFYIDTGLTNGVAYYYVVVAVDSLGNESAYSNEATGTPSDTTPLSKPIISFPTIREIPVVLYRDRTDICGTAKPATTVDLYRDGVLVSRTTALQNNDIQIFSMDNSIYNASLSPDGRRLTYEYNNSIWLKELITGNTTLIINPGYIPTWSPDGRKLAYVFWDNKGYWRIGIYDMESGTNTSLTADTDVYEYSPSWSFDGKSLAFISNRGGAYDVWMKDFTTGAITQITNNINPDDARLSPDGKKIAYFKDIDLYIYDIMKAATNHVATGTDGYSLDWSPDSNRLAFVSLSNGDGDIFVFDINSRKQTQITDSTDYEDTPLFSPDGNNIVFIRWQDNASIWITSSSGENLAYLLRDNINELNHLSWVRSGGIASIEQDKLIITYLKGYFRFKDIELRAGENVFEAISIDQEGRVSQPSDEIIVAFEIGLMPDLETTTEDIFIYPPYPIAGEDVAINVVVRNKGQTDVRDVDVDIYLWDSSGNLELLKSERISNISSGSAEVIGVYWNSADKLGINSVIAVIDPENKIHEYDETNNLAMKEIVVNSLEGISMTTTLDREQYQANQDLNIHVNLLNSGMEKNVTIHA
ncbi:MAG: DPP IV N-terminal domain-containing protein, partial [Candidatus Aenigmatarchaeota archaeon]